MPASRQLRQDSRGRLVLSVAVPIQDLRLVRGALMVSIGGGKIEKEIADVNVVFIQLFGIVMLITVALSFYLARSITTPITQLAAEADTLRRSRNDLRRACSAFRNGATKLANFPSP